MIRMFLYYGGIGAVILIATNFLVLLVAGIPGPEDYAMGEVLGYATIVAALAVSICLGVRDYRDARPGEGVSFVRAALIGVVITDFPALAFAAYHLFYVTVIDPGFTQKYMDYQLESARRSMSAEAFQTHQAAMEAQSGLFANVVIQTIVMYLTVLFIGAGISLLVAFFMRTRKRRR